MTKDLNQPGAYNVDWQQLLEDENVSLGGGFISKNISVGTNADTKAFVSEVLVAGTKENEELIPFVKHAFVQVRVPDDYTFTPDSPMSITLQLAQTLEQVNGPTRGLRAIGQVTFDDDTTTPTANLQIFPGQTKTYVMPIENDLGYNGRRTGLELTADDGFFTGDVLMYLSGVGTAGPSGEKIQVNVTAEITMIPSLAFTDPVFAESGMSGEPKV